MSWVDLIVLALAGGCLTDVWFNGSIFAALRSYCEARESGSLLTDFDAATVLEARRASLGSAGAAQEYTWWMKWADRLVPDLVIEMLNCSFCFSHHAVFWPALLFYAPSLFVAAPWSHLLRLPVYVMAAVRLGNLLDAWAPKWACYNRYQE